MTINSNFVIILNQVYLKFNQEEIIVDLRTSIAVLGETKVITRDQAHTAFNQPESNDHVMIRYFEDSVRKCAEMNAMGQDFRLVYGLPLSFREQRQIIGVNPNRQPCFNSDDHWWLGYKEDAWAKSQPEAGYYLIDFKGQFNRTNWNDQNDRIIEMGEQYERADERVFSQSLISIFKTHGQRLHKETCHWGLLEDSKGYRVCAGFFGFYGLWVVSGHPSRASDSIGRDSLLVCVSLKFDF